jgi:hypothetical protein
MRDGRKNPEPWWWRTQVFLILAALLFVVIAASFLRQFFSVWSDEQTDYPRYASASTTAIAADEPTVPPLVWGRREHERNN